jgi:DNA repair protein SbcD/Mre11
VMHGEVTTGSNEYNPISRESIAESGFNYIALGHRHEFSGILKEEKTSFAYAGIPEGRGFDELGEKGIIHGEVFETGTSLSFRKMNKRSYSIIPVSLTGAYTTSEICDRILESIEKRSDILRIELTGKVPSYLNIDIEGITAALDSHLSYFTITDRTSVNESKEHISENTLKGLFLKTIMERKESSTIDHELLDEAESLGLRILSSEDF